MKTKTDLCKCGEPKECHGSYGCLSSGCECKEYRPCLRFTDYTPKGKDSAGANGEEGGKATLASRLGVKPRSSSTPAEPAPFQPFEEWLETEINGWLPENELSHAAYEVMLEEKRILQKHRDLCHSIDEEKLAEWMFEHPRVCQHHSWATTFPRTKQKYIEYAKEAIEYAKRK